LPHLIFRGRAFDGEKLHQKAVLDIDPDTGIIAGFGEEGSLETRKDAKTVDLGDSTVLPGLIDAHVHFYSSTGVGVNAWAAVPDTLAVLRGAGDMRKLLNAGFTAVRDLGSKGGVHLAQAVEEGAIEGPAVVSCSRALAQTGEDDDPPAFPLDIAQKLATYSYFCDGPWECRRAVRKVVRDGGKVVKFYASGAFSRGGRVRPNFTEEEIQAIVDESHRAGLPVAAHAYGEEALSAAVKAGVDSVEHGLGLTAEIAREMAKKGIYYVPTLTVYQLKTYANRNKKLVTQHLTDDLVVAREKGVEVVTGSDIVGDADRPHGMSHREVIAEAKFIGNLDALVASTSRAAKCIRLEGRGLLKEGFRADVAVVKGDPTKDIEAVAPERVTRVLKGGRTVFLRSQNST
jgi:imidazolonepropionase-like amidohydrolase